VDCLAVFEECGLRPVLEGIVETFFLRLDDKINACWLQGPTSCGKSTLCNVFREVFLCQKGDFVKGHLVVQDKTFKKDLKTQVICFQEFNLDLALKSETLPLVLQLFEGDNAPVKGNLYERYEQRYRDTLWLIASNKLPKWADSVAYPRLFETQWKPLLTRTNVIQLQESFIGQKCPYNAAIMAGALMQLL